MIGTKAFEGRKVGWRGPLYTWMIAAFFFFGESQAACLNADTSFGVHAETSIVEAHTIPIKTAAADAVALVMYVVKSGYELCERRPGSIHAHIHCLAVPQDISLVRYITIVSSDGSNLAAQPREYTLPAIRTVAAMGRCSDMAATVSKTRDEERQKLADTWRRRIEEDRAVIKSDLALMHVESQNRE